MDDNMEEYCICRSTDISRFMIGCDNCNEWYHGDCIGMTAEESNFIKTFYCDICRRSDPSLKIRYKKPKVKERESSSSSHRKHDKSDKRDKHDKHSSHHSSSSKHSSHSSHSKKHSHSSKEREREREKHKKKKDKHREREKEKERHEKHEKKHHKEKHRDKDKKKSSSSHGSSSSAVKPLVALPDSDSEEKLSVKSESPDVSPCTTPVPGSPVGAPPGATPWRADTEISPKSAPTPGPQQLDPRKLDQVPPPPPSSAQFKQDKQRDQKRDFTSKHVPLRELMSKPPAPVRDFVKQPPPQQQQQPRQTGVVRVEEVSGKKGKAGGSKECGTCTACSRTDDCGFCDNCIDRKKTGSSKRKCRLRQCRNQGYVGGGSGGRGGGAQTGSEWDDLPTDDVDIPMNPSDLANLIAKAKASPAGKRGGRPPKKDPIMDTPPKRKYNKRKPDVAPTPPKRKYRRRRQESSAESSSEEEEVKQCFGPGCIEPAKSNSKYCSDMCGMKLAKDRIIEILPTRVDQWQRKPCVADIKNKEQLNKIRAQMDKHRAQLMELDRKRTELDSLIERAKKTPSLNEEEIEKYEEEEEDPDPEMTIYCVTCGHQCNEKTAVKHMEKCYVKVEARSSFASMYKARIEFTAIICDHFCSNTNSYCKRLKVLCPEHTKDPKARTDEVCGYPQTKDLFTFKGDFCRLPKRKCNKHVCWEKLRRAAIDQERLSKWIKLDELLDQERNMRVCMAERAGLLSLVLHQTIDHDPASNLVLPPTRDVEDIVDACSL